MSQIKTTTYQQNGVNSWHLKSGIVKFCCFMPWWHIKIGVIMLSRLVTKRKKYLDVLFLRFAIHINVHDPIVIPVGCICI